MVAVDAKLGKWRAAHSQQSLVQRLLEIALQRPDSPQQIAFLRTSAQKTKAAADAALAEVELAIAALKAQSPPSSSAPS